MSEYSYDDYRKEELERYNKLFPPINYKKLRIARKQHFCEVCGCEIHKNELVWWYKPNPTYNSKTKKNDYYKWQTRCYDHEPLNHEELKSIGGTNYGRK